MYNFISDPGHGWIEVKRQELKELNIADQITQYSYTNGGTVYLEEDQDAYTFIKAYQEKHGSRPDINEVVLNHISPIRNLPRYK